MTSALGEPIWFAEWNDDAKTFLADCLSIPSDKLVDIKIDWESRKAEVVVHDKETAAIAIGSRGVNVRLTGKITGLIIQILFAGDVTDKARPQPASVPEDLLKEAIVEEIPEVANGTIVMLNMIRDPSVQSKVVVRHSSTDAGVVPTCVGTNNHHVNALVDKLKESVWFVEWVENHESFLINCLGVEPNDVLSVKINKSMNTAEVLVTNRVICAKAIGTQGINVRQAAHLAGLRTVRVITNEQSQL